MRTQLHPRAVVPRAVARAVLGLLGTAVIAAGCAGGPILANAPVVRPTAPPATAKQSPPRDPLPIVLPADDAPHRRLTEWWYYTGHLAAADGRRFGFEFVVFRAERGDFPVSWASHLALTDETGGRFTYAQRAVVGPQVDRSASDSGFDLALPAADPGAGPEVSWAMAGNDGADRLIAALTPAEGLAAGLSGGFGLDLRLSTSRPPALHDEDGWIDFGPAGGSYYYSRTRMSATGTLTIADERLDVDGLAWFDHQWGDFVAVGGGGWDWFAVNLDDGTDLTLSLVRDADGSYPLIYGTLVKADGSVRHLPRDAFSFDVTGRWTSPRTGADYPAGWIVRVPDEGLEITLVPTVADQELDTRLTTGVVYWEGSQHVDATRRGTPVAGMAYVELTGYAPTVGESEHASRTGRSPAAVTGRGGSAD